MESLEEIYAALPHGQCHFLVNADDVAAVPILAGAYGRGSMDRLHDKDRDVEFGSLHRISDELAEFARTLARMAEPDGESKVSDNPVSFRAAPMGGFQGFPLSTPETSPPRRALKFARTHQAAPVARQILSARPFRGPRMGYPARFKASGAGRTASVGIKPVHCLCCAAHYGVALGDRHDRQRHAFATSGPSRRPQRVY